MKYCIIINETHHDFKMPFIYKNVAAMCAWFPDEAKYINLFNTVKEAEYYIETKLSNLWQKKAEVVPYEEVQIAIVEHKLRQL